MPTSQVPGPLLGWLLDGTVGAEGPVAAAGHQPGSWRTAAVQDSDGLLPVQVEQVRGQPTVLLNHLLGLNGVVDYLGNHLVTHPHEKGEDVSAEANRDHSRGVLLLASPRAFYVHFVPRAQDHC